MHLSLNACVCRVKPSGLCQGPEVSACTPICRFALGFVLLLKCLEAEHAATASALPSLRASGSSWLFPLQASEAWPLASRANHGEQWCERPRAEHVQEGHKDRALLPGRMLSVLTPREPSVCSQAPHASARRPVSLSRPKGSLEKLSQ